MTMIRSSLKCSLSSCWRDSNQGLWGLSSSDTNQAASPAAAAGGSSWWLLPGWWNNETGRSAKIGRWQGGCRGGGGVFGGSTAEAKQKGKHVCRGNQREGRLTTRACQRTKPAHKHGDYASESERRVTDKRNNAIKPFWSFIKVLLKKKKRERDFTRRCQLEGRTSCWDLCHTGAPSVSSFFPEGDERPLSSPSPLMAPEHSRY